LQVKISQLSTCHTERRKTNGNERKAGLGAVAADG
jgi:hypothetical protein